MQYVKWETYLCLKVSNHQILNIKLYVAWPNGSTHWKYLSWVPGNFFPTEPSCKCCSMENSLQFSPDKTKFWFASIIPLCFRTDSFPAYCCTLPRLADASAIFTHNKPHPRRSNFIAIFIHPIYFNIPKVTSSKNPWFLFSLWSNVSRDDIWMVQLILSMN